MSQNIPIIDFVSKMTEVKKMGFVATMRRGNTGIGFTLETLLGIRENNYAKHDFMDSGEFKDVKFELKSQRDKVVDPRKKKPSKSSHLISLVTQAPHGGMSNSELILQYGYSDSKGRKRKNLYATINATKFINSKHKFLSEMKIKRDGDRVHLIVDNKQIAYVDLNLILDKLRNLLIVRADVEWKKCNCNNTDLHMNNYHEYFHFNKPYVFTGFNKNNFYKSIDDGEIYYDLRMHIPEGEIIGNEGYDTKHDHGTGFRTKFENIPKFYNNLKTL